MVTRILLLTACTAGVLLPHALPAADLPRYRAGDIATNTIVTPVPLVVEDPVGTALLKAKEERDFRYIVRYSPAIFAEVERAFRSQMALVQADFLDELEKALGRRQVDKSVQRDPEWLALTDAFREKHKGVPKLFLYMPYWAQGRSDEHLLQDWIGRMRQAMDAPIRPDTLPAGSTGTTVRLITVPNLDVQVELEHTERYGVLTPVNDLIPLSKARRNLEAGFPEGDAYVAEYLGPFLRSNCVFDEDLTRQMRERAADSVVVAASYAAGDVIVRNGQTLDAKALAALEELRRQLAGTVAPDGAGAPPMPRGGASSIPPWALGAIGGGAVALVGILVILLRRKPAGLPVLQSGSAGQLRPSLPASRADANLASPDPLTRQEGESEREWRERALAAERRAERARELARSKVTTALKDKVVQHLSTQRDELLDHQNSAAEQMIGLEARLERIQGPLSERLRAYERRIAELEEELAVKDEENRALIRAKIQNLREQMAREKAGRSSYDLN